MFNNFSLFNETKQNCDSQRHSLCTSVRRRMYNVLNPPWCTSRCDNSENIQNVKASLNVLNLSYVAVFSETNTWINGLQQCHYLLRYQHVWVEHRFEASLDRRHVVREAAGERRRDSAELERCDTTGEAWNLKSTMSGRSGGKIKSLKLSGEKENRCTTDT